ncbi:MAG: family 43 glycosylhydrolase [Pseudarcicella sp.]|nr:family 43 glycosylhydrolase [Pseudarcicella sp.]MBP6411362.1 family 43 glycosylhydrolase [Pseudarcicella sp.]
MRKICLFLVLTLFSLENIAQKSYKLSEIRVRDPFIYADKKTKKYHLYVQIANRIDGPQKGVEMYESKDLKNWKGPKTVLELPQDFWAQKSVWAPEVHYHNQKYYMFVTLTSEDKIKPENDSITNQPQWKRGTQIFYADSPTGPFKAFENKSHTPQDWMSLDGTLFIEKGKPYLVFCHEWAQISDGTIDLVALKNDLSATIGKPKKLFSASEASWVRNMEALGMKSYKGLVTDGPFFYKNKKKELVMIWSSFGVDKYAIGMALSKNGSLFGPWKQIKEPLVKANGGHGMFFKTFDGKQKLVFHQPNSGTLERAVLVDIFENQKGLLQIK